jgi:hypothetical protein
MDDSHNRPRKSPIKYGGDMGKHLFKQEIPIDILMEEYYRNCPKPHSSRLPDDCYYELHDIDFTEDNQKLTKEGWTWKK